MANDLIVGTPTKCGVDTGTNVITYYAGEWNHFIFYQLTTDHYLANITQTDVQAITAIGGEQANGDFLITVADASDWVNGDSISPQRQATTYKYDDMADAVAAGAEGDSFFIWYYYDSAQGTTTWHYYGMRTIGYLASFEGMLGIRRVQLTGNSSLEISAHTATLGASDNVYIRNMKLGTEDNRTILLNAIAGTYGNIIIDSCEITNEGVASIGILVGTPDVIIQNCFVHGIQVAIQCTTAATNAITRHSTVCDCVAGIKMDATDETQECYNNMSVSGWIDYSLEDEVDRSNNLSRDATADGTGSLASQTIADCALWKDLADVRAGIIDCRITTDSTAYHAGKTSGVELDADGNERHATTPSMGWHEGHDDLFYVAGDYPAITNVRYGTSYSNGDLVGTLVLPAKSDVRKDVSYG